MLGFIYLILRQSSPKILADFYIIRENNNREKCKIKLILLQFMSSYKTHSRVQLNFTLGRKMRVFKRVQSSVVD